VPIHFPLRLVGSRMLAPSVRHLDFVRDDGSRWIHPGQFIQVHFSLSRRHATKRSYSLATIHDHALGPGESVQIAVSYVAGGAATTLFEGLDEGQQIEASGPTGAFCLGADDANRRYLLIGTGTGVTPYRAMLPQLAQMMAQRGVEVVLLFGARTPAN
jgi:ferredoxin-NADP reductase